jgi:hypothetical protein
MLTRPGHALAESPHQLLGGTERLSNIVAQSTIRTIVGSYAEWWLPETIRRLGERLFRWPRYSVGLVAPGRPATFRDAGSLEALCTDVAALKPGFGKPAADFDATAPPKDIPSGSQDFSRATCSAVPPLSSGAAKAESRASTSWLFFWSARFAAHTSPGELPSRP